MRSETKNHSSRPAAVLGSRPRAPRGFLTAAAMCALLDSKQRVVQPGAKLPNWIPQGHRENTLLGNGLDRNDYYLYDTMTVALNTAFPAKTVMFTSPQQGSTKNLSQTNMDAFGQLIAPEIFVVRALRLFFLNNITPTDLLTVYTNVSFVLSITKKPLFKGTAWMYPAGGGLWFYGSQLGTAPAGAAPVYSSSNGVPDVRCVYSLRDPLTINAGERFDLTVTAETAFNTQAAATNPPGVGITLVAALEGSLHQAVR